MNRSHRRYPTLIAGLVLVGATALAACGSSRSSASGTTSTTTRAKTSSTSAAAKSATGLRGKRYCEVLLLHPEPAGLTADVYNSYPMNLCPEAQWQALNAQQIAQQNQAMLANLNGPRYWLMDRIDKTVGTSGPTKDFGGIEMTQRATVLVTDPATAQKPYLSHEINRKTVFTFDKGSTVYELTDPQGQKWIMQSWSQEIDPTLAESDLPGLASKLQLPAGWTYSSRTLTAPLTIATVEAPAKVTTDDLKDTYSLEGTR